jgi:acetyl esterase/lipase
LLYLHGGGYFAGSPQTHRPITGWFARAGFAVFAPDYRLAPEHPFPAALDDARAAYGGLLAAGHAAARLVVAGDSAGGGLALALLLALRDADVALPAAGCLFSAWTDLAGTGASMQENAQIDAMFWPEGLPQAAAFYLNGADPRTPYASPLYGDYAGLPPLLLHVGERELLRDDSVRVAARAPGAQLRVWPVVPHVWQLLHAFLPEARESLTIAAGFLGDAVKVK